MIVPYPDLPQTLSDLYYKNDRKSKFFMENIRSFNSMFAFTSMGGKIKNSMKKGWHSTNVRNEWRELPSDW